MFIYISDTQTIVLGAHPTPTGCSDNQNIVLVTHPTAGVNILQKRVNFCYAYKTFILFNITFYLFNQGGTLITVEQKREELSLSAWFSNLR